MPEPRHISLLDDTRQTGVYRIRHLLTNKKYVGSAAVSFKSRWSKHRRELNAGKHHSPHLQRAWNKYGEDAFVFEIVERTEPQHAVAQEEVFIAYWKATDPDHGYNQCARCSSPLGLKRSAETRKKMSDSLKRANSSEEKKELLRERNRQRVWTPESRAKLADHNRGRKHSEKTREKIAAVSRNMSQETRDKISAAAKGRNPTEQQRQRLIEYNRTREMTQEIRDKIGAGNRGKTVSEEARAKISVAGKGRTQSPEHVAKRVAARAASYVVSDETRQKMSESARNRQHTN